MAHACFGDGKQFCKSFKMGSGQCRDVQDVVHHTTGWITLYYRLPSHLPDFSHLTLRSMEVAAVAPATPPASLDGPCFALGYVGQLSLTEHEAVQNSH